jgi:hypothetical protein
MLKDCLQEAFKRAFMRIDLFEEPRAFHLAFRIGVTQALTCLRSNKKSYLFRDTVDEDVSAR